MVHSFPGPQTAPEPRHAAVDAAPRTLTMYARSWCGLCDEMYIALGPLAAGLNFQVDVVYIDDDPQLEALHGMRVPVLCEGASEICHFTLDTDALRRHLAVEADERRPDEKAPDDG